MPLNKTIKRELDVAFNKNAQPLWIRISKYLVLILLIWMLWGTPWLWITFSTLLSTALCVHLFYRYKTQGWTKSFRGWKYHD